MYSKLVITTVEMCMTLNQFTTAFIRFQFHDLQKL